jgi:hypothetical protein
MRNPPHYIEILPLQSHLLIPHLMIYRGPSENRDLWSSRDYFLLIKLSSSSVVTPVWSHQDRILISLLIDLSTTSKISRYERNHLDLNKSSRLNDRKTTRFEVNILMKKLTIRIVSNKQVRFVIESFMHEELNDDVMKQKSADQIRWSNHLIFLIFFEKTNFSSRSRFAISSTHLIISIYHNIASSFYLSTYFLSLTSRCSDWSILLIDQMNDVDQMKLSQKFLVLLSRQHLDEIVCWHLCSRASIHTDSIRLNLLSQSVSMNINMFQLNIKLQHLFFQHAKKLTIVAANVKFFHRIESNWFKKSSSSDRLLRDSTQSQ